MGTVHKHLPPDAIRAFACAVALCLSISCSTAQVASVLAVEPPSALYALLRGTPEEMYATLKREQCLNAVALENPDKVVAAIRAAEAEWHQMVGGSVLLGIQTALTPYLNDKGRRLAATINLPTSLGPITFARDISSDQNPAGASTQFSAGIKKIYAIFEVLYLKSTDVIVGVWYRGGEKILEQKLTGATPGPMPSGILRATFASEAGITPGSYRLDLNLNGIVVRTGAFDVRPKPWWKVW